MRTLGRVGVSSAVLGIVLMGAQGTASAQVIPSLDVAIQLEPGAPSTGELVSGIREIDGVAEAIEGVRRIDLYVMPAGLTRSLENAVPVDSMTSDVPLSRANFELEWDTSRTPAGVVDVVVVARSATRTGQLSIPSVRVARAVQDSAGTASAAAPQAKRGTAPVAATSTSRGPAAAAATVARRPARVALAGATPTAPRAAAAETGQAQAAAFYKVYGQLPYTADVSRPTVIRTATDTTHGPWPYVAAGMVLIVSAGHVQRAVRSPLGRRS